MDEAAAVRKKGAVGYAALYLMRCDKEELSYDEIEIQAYLKLTELDSKLGTTVTEQLYGCVIFAIGLDLVKVLNNLRVIY